MERMNYKKDLRIDPEALDVECLRQPTLFMEYAEAAAEARRDMDSAKERMEVMRASIDGDVRKNPIEFIGEGIKVTEATISAAVIQSVEYQESIKEYLEDKHDYELLSAAVKAFEQRKSTLEYLIRLNGQQYFSGPDSPRDLKTEYGRFVGDTKKEMTRKKIRDRGKEE